MKTAAKLWIGIGILIVFSPLGLLLPEHFKAGGAWGEWKIDSILSGIWSAPIPGYAFKGWEGKGLGGLSLAYIVSAIIGILIIVCVILLIGRLLSKKK